MRAKRNQQLYLNGHKVQITHAATFLTRARGLLGRRLGDNEGLLITPCSAVHSFGMRYPIDVVFLDRNHIVKKVVTNLRPWRIASCIGSRSVLELPVGAVQRLALTPGLPLED
jgi:uncharacterized membrane protein (UPF0127 family)